MKKCERQMGNTQTLSGYNIGCKRSTKNRPNRFNVFVVATNRLVSSPDVATLVHGSKARRTHKTLILPLDCPRDFPLSRVPLDVVMAHARCPLHHMSHMRVRPDLYTVSDDSSLSSHS